MEAILYFEAVTCKAFIYKLLCILSCVYIMKYYKVIKFSLKIFRSIAIGTKITKIFTYENLELYGKVVTKRFSSLLSSYWIVV